MSDTRKQDRKLPAGMAEFDQLIADLTTEYGDELPTKDIESIKFAVSTNIMHLGPEDSHKSLEFFYKRIVAAAAKQIAHHVFAETKQKQQQRIADEQAAAAAKEVTNESKE